MPGHLAGTESERHGVLPSNETGSCMMIADRVRGLRADFFRRATWHPGEALRIQSDGGQGHQDQLIPTGPMLPQRTDADAARDARDSNSDPLYFFANLISIGLGPLAAGALSDTLPLARAKNRCATHCCVCVLLCFGPPNIHWRAASTVTTI